MLAINYSTIRNHLKNYCDRAVDENAVVIVTRKEEKNVVLLSLEHYNRLAKTARNAEYLSKIERGFAQLDAGECRPHELIEVADE